MNSNRKFFLHTPLENPLPELYSKTSDEDGVRHYTTPEGRIYSSVTTILSILSKDFLDKWRERVGIEEAHKITEHGCERGTELHGILEEYIKNRKPIFSLEKKSKVKIMFNRMQRVLDSSVDNVVAQEVPLYSDTLQTAGRCDLIAEYKNIPSIIDFKGATKGKKKDWIEGYFLQATAYSLMWEERTGIKISQIVIMMCGENDFSLPIFVEDRSKYEQRLKEVINEYYSRK